MEFENGLIEYDTKLTLAWDGAKKEIQAKVLDATYSAKGVPVKAEVGFTFVGWDGQNWALSEGT